MGPASPDQALSGEMRCLAFRRHVDAEKLRAAQQRVVELLHENAEAAFQAVLLERKLGHIADRLAYFDRVVQEGCDVYRPNFERRKRSRSCCKRRSRPRSGRRGWLPQDLAARLAPAAGLRNRLVHQYAEIDDRKVFDAVISAVDLFPTYIAHLRKLIERE